MLTTDPTYKNDLSRNQEIDVFDNGKVDADCRNWGRDNEIVREPDEDEGDTDYNWFNEERFD